MKLMILVLLSQFIFTSAYSQVSDTTKSTLEAMPANSTKQEVRNVKKVMSEVDAQAEPEAPTKGELDSSEASFDCKTWFKEGKGPSIGNKDFFIRDLSTPEKHQGLFLDGDRTVVIHAESGISVISIISDAWVALMPRGFLFYPLREQKLEPGMVGVMQGLVLFGANPDLTNTLSFSQLSGNLRILRLVREKDKSGVFSCSAKDGCYLSINEKRQDLRRGSSARAFLVNSGATSPRSVESIDLRCRWITSKGFQDKINSAVQKISNSCQAFKGKVIATPNFRELESACKQWTTQIRQQVQSLN